MIDKILIIYPIEICTVSVKIETANKKQKKKKSKEKSDGNLHMCQSLLKNGSIRDC